MFAADRPRDEPSRKMAHIESSLDAAPGTVLQTHIQNSRNSFLHHIVGT